MAEGVTEAVETPELSAETLALAEKGRAGAPVIADPLAVQTIPAPAGIPEKFWDPIEGKVRTDDLVKSYAELEKKIGEKAPADELTDEQTAAAAAEAEEAAKAAEEAEKLKEEGADDGADTPPELATAVEAAQAAYAEAGELSDEIREPIRKAGISDEQIDLYIAGVKAVEASLEEAITAPFGSREAYDAAAAWAAETWTPKQAEAFNSQTGSVEGAKVAGEMLYAAFVKANPSEGQLVNINTGITHGDVYTAMADFREDLRKADAVRDQNARSKALDKLKRSRTAKSIK